MIVTIKTDKLKVGMFVDLSGSWLENPFWKERFMITDEAQIEKIIDAGIKQVNIDTSKGNTIPDNTDRTDNNMPEGQTTKDGSNKVIIDKQSGQSLVKPLPNKIHVSGIDKGKTTEDEGKDIPPPVKWEPEKFMPKEIVDAVKDKGLAPEKRANAVYKYSLEMMKHVLEHPTTENISATKEGVAEIVDIILNEGDTTSNLFKIVSHDYYTYTHSVNVGVKAILIARTLYGGARKHDMHELGAGFFLHDLGKVKISADIINKHGKLTEAEMQIMRTHPDEGYKILSQVKQLSAEIWIIALQHHEREDGSGYPRGLSGSSINDYARICYIADVYDALTSERSYKKKLPPLDAIRVMKEEMLHHFNRGIFANFVSLFKEIKS